MTNNNTVLNAAPYILAFLLSLGSGLVSAQVSCDSGAVCTQTITLTPGWNSIYVQVNPQDNQTEQVLAELLDGTGPQLSSVWTWLAHRAKVEFIQDPAPSNLLSESGWLRYFPAQSQQAFLTNLHAIQANRAYLIKLEGVQDVTLSISGTPVVPKANWEPGSFNHVGFHVDPQNLPTFRDFFASSAAHQGQPIYQLIADQWRKVDPLTTVIQPDVAYWVFSNQGSDYTGPLHVELPQLNRLEYRSTLKQLTAELQNTQATTQSVSIAVVGAAPGMLYPNPDQAATQPWLPLPQPLTMQLAVDGTSRLPLGLKRADFHPGNFEHTLEITSSAGSRWLIPVTASAPPLHSLWVGTVTIDQVSQAQNYQHDCVDEKVDGEYLPNLATQGSGYDLCRDAEGFPVGDSGSVLTPVAAEFSFRIILHRDTANQVRLLKDVIQMWEDGVDGAPGHYVLLTDDTLIPNYKGVTLRGGEAVGRRISTMAYDFPGDTLDMSGLLGQSLSATLNLAPTAPSNPYRHYYHPDHNNLAVDYATPNNEAYGITRTMELTFTESTDQIGSGYDYMEGSYREVVSGLHKYPIIAAGHFSLRHSAPTEELNQ